MPATRQAGVAAVEPNRAVAVAMRDGPAAGLAPIDAILERGQLDAFHLAHAARADLLRRLGWTAEARAAYRRALQLTRQEPSAASSSAGCASERSLRITKTTGSLTAIRSDVG